MGFKAIQVAIVAASVALALCGCGPALPSAPPEALSAFSAEAFAEHVRLLADPAREGRAAGSAGGAQAGEYIAAQFAKTGLSPGGDGGTWFQHFDAAGRPCRNVVGTLACPGRADAPAIVIGAHYDHLGIRNGEVYCGADDNASGCSALMLIARAMARTPGRACNFVFVAFDAEEIGFLGSKFYVANPVAPLRRTAMLLNMDQIGYVRKEKLLVLGSLLNPTVFRGLDMVRDKHDLKVTSLPVTNTKGWSDQAPFARLGLPTLFFYCGRTRYYHTPQDTAEKINNDGGAQTANLVYDVARAMDAAFAVAHDRKVGVGR